jgi:putative FmdB family regulatory protein
MPIYEFRCGECRKKFEKIVLSGAAPASAECPKCGKKGAARQVSRFATASKSGGDDWGGDFGGDGGGDDDGGGMDDLGGGGFGGADGGDDAGDGGGDDGGDLD